MSDRLYDATRRLLERLDTLDEQLEHTMETAIYKAIREIANEAAVSQLVLWREAVKVERDPVERHRAIIGQTWKPSLR